MRDAVVVVGAGIVGAVVTGVETVWVAGVSFAFLGVGDLGTRAMTVGVSAGLGEEIVEDAGLTPKKLRAFASARAFWARISMPSISGLATGVGIGSGTDGFGASSST